ERIAVPQEDHALVPAVLDHPGGVDAGDEARVVAHVFDDGPDLLAGRAHALPAGPADVAPVPFAPRVGPPNERSGARARALLRGERRAARWGERAARERDGRRQRQGAAPG